MTQHLSRFLTPGLSLVALLCCLGCGSGTHKNSGAVETDAGTDSLLAQHCDETGDVERYQANASGLVTSSAQDDSLIPCFHETGIGSAENTLAIAKDGAVLVAPAFTKDGNGFLRTSDDGEHWEVVVPGQHGGHDHGRVQPFMMLDAATQRLFYASAAGGGSSSVGFDLSISDDLGKTFRKSSVGQGTGDWIKLIAAPAVSSKPKYANLIYASSPFPISTAGLPGRSPMYQQVQRSLDGGETFSDVAHGQLSIVPTDNDCPSTEYVIYGNGVADQDGALYLGLRRCTRLAVAVSRDEGKTWIVSDVPGSELVPHTSLLDFLSKHNILASEALAMDQQQNLYAIWADKDATLRLAVSRDRAKSWSDAVVINAPAAPIAVLPSIAASDRGHIAIAYYGSQDDKVFDAFIAESNDALNARPTFMSARVNPASAHLYEDGFDEGYTGIVSGGDLIEIVQVRFAPNGDIWAAFSKDMCPGPGVEGQCTWDRAAHADSAYQAVVGRLVHKAESPAY